MLGEYKQEADAGHELTVAEIRKGFEEKIGREASLSYVYRVLKRHRWRQVMPRSKHPKAATKEEQDASKKFKAHYEKIVTKPKT